MPDSPDKKTATLTIKTKVSGPEPVKKISGSIGQKTGARAHQRTRLQTEQKQAGTARSTESTQQPSEKAPTKRLRTPDKRTATNPGARRPRPPSEVDQPHRHRPDLHGEANKRMRTSHPLAMAAVPDLAESFHMFASCPRGLEAALAQELIGLGLKDVQSAQAGCRFRGNWSDVWRANLHSRLATRVLVQLAHGKIANEQDLRALAMNVEWERWLGPEKTMRVDTSAIRSPMQSLQYCNLLVKDSVCDRLREKEGARPSIDTVRPDVRVHSFLAHDSATLYLDTSGESLFKRGWRLDKAEAPIRENLAAGLLAISGWHPSQALLDPFCGSGTILIEAAWMALKIPPGINRPFAFERLRVHDKLQWQAMRQEATAGIGNQLSAPIVGSDLSARAIEAAKLNMQRAGLAPGLIEWQVTDARTLTAPAESGVIVTNPPYGERLDIESGLMTAWASQLKRAYAGWHVNVITADHNLPSAMRLQPRRRVPLFNGALDCRVFMFDIVGSSYRPKERTGAAKKQQNDET